MKFTPYQQIEFIIHNCGCITIDTDLEESKIIVSVTATSLCNFSVNDGSIEKAVQKAFDKFTIAMGHTIGNDE